MLNLNDLSQETIDVNSNEGIDNVFGVGNGSGLLFVEGFP